MIKIGFVDYYIDEWHAQNACNRLPAISEELGIACEIVGAYAELDASPRGITTDEWCEKNGIGKFESVDALAEVCDAFMIFAPDNPETHLRLARAVLPYGKPTFIDKTFAASAAEAKEIIDIAKHCGTPMFSSSSLRFAKEVQAAKRQPQVTVHGGYAVMKDYLVHTHEILVTVIGTGACGVQAEINGDEYIFDIMYPDGRGAKMYMTPGYPPYIVNGVHIESDFFCHQLKAILLFFSGDAVPFDASETIEVARLIDASLAAIKSPGATVNILQ